MKYKDAGVDIDYADFIKKKIRRFIIDISKERFSGLFKIDRGRYIASTIDGVGTKVILAKEVGYLEGVGMDIVNHCVNDLLCSGAKPLFFLDYIASSNLKKLDIVQILKGIRKALVENDAFLLGGETAEMPDIYRDENFDLVGCMIGIVEKKDIIPKKIKEGDLIFGLKSSGLHTNGFSLVRKIIRDNNINLDRKIKGKKLKNILLTPHRSYYKLVYPLIKKGIVKALVHITGGGFEGNLKRVLPDGLDAIIDFKDFEIPEIFLFIQKEGDVPWNEMFRIFNMGIGMLVVLDERDEKRVVEYFKKKRESIYLLGKILKGKGKYVEIIFRR